MKIQMSTGLTRLLAVVFVSLFLASCGGGSSSGDGTDDGTLDGDPSLNPEGEFETDDPFDPLDGDHDGDGVPNSEDLDFVDENFNGINDADELAEEPVETDLGPCLGQPGTDSNSSNADWSDNCQLAAGSEIPLMIRDSSYTRGVQRILTCLGYDVAADGSYGPLTAAAVQQFQEDNPQLGADGIVGPATWGALQDVLVRSTFDQNTDSFSVLLDVDGDGIEDGGTCNGVIQFYQDVDPATGEGLGFSMAEEPGSLVKVVFGVGFQ